MKNTLHRVPNAGIGFLLILFLASMSSFAQNAPDPYAETKGSSQLKEPGLINIISGNINVLSTGLASLSTNLKLNFKNYMLLWVESEESGPHSIEWELHSPDDGTYEIKALVLADDADFELVCNGEKHKIKVKAESWSRISLGTIQLKKGKNRLLLLIYSDQTIKLSSLELIQPLISQMMDQETLAMRQNADWFKDAGYGLMFQWTNRATPLTGNSVKEWEEKVNDFDVAAFADMVEETGAAYVIWSITWGQQYISAPLFALDRLIDGRTSSRDMLGEMADLLNKKGIKLIFYYHYGYDCYHSIDSSWMQSAGGYKEDKADLYQNISSILSELGTRYESKLSGWWFDGGHRYYDCHFDYSKKGILSAPFMEITQAARSGNPNRIIAYNSWILPKLTEYQDYFSGEGLKQYSELEEGVFPDGPYEGLMAHSCFPLEKRWGHIDLNTPISAPKLTLEQLIERIQHAQKNRYPLSINLEMYEDGSVSPESLELLKNVRAHIRSY